jgi:hypothetical protein
MLRTMAVEQAALGNRLLAFADRLHHGAVVMLTLVNQTLVVHIQREGKVFCVYSIASNATGSGNNVLFQLSALDKAALDARRSQ